MNNTYGWLFDNYAVPKMQELVKDGDMTAEALLKRLKLTGDERMEVWDTLEHLRYQWGAEVFALGLQLGVRLTAPAGHDAP